MLPLRLCLPPPLTLPSCSGFPRSAAEDQAGAAQPVLRAELQLQPGAALQAPLWREVSVQRQVGHKSTPATSTVAGTSLRVCC